MLVSQVRDVTKPTLAIGDLVSIYLEDDPEDPDCRVIGVVTWVVPEEEAGPAEGIMGFNNPEYLYFIMPLSGGWRANFTYKGTSVLRFSENSRMRDRTEVLAALLDPDK